MSLKDSFFEKVKRKTNVDKNTIYDKMTGKKVSEETSDKIISKIQNDEVPKGIDKFF